MLLGAISLAAPAKTEAVVVWDGLTFKPQKVYSDVSAASMALGTNAMMLGLFVDYVLIHYLKSE